MKSRSYFSSDFPVFRKTFIVAAIAVAIVTSVTAVAGQEPSDDGWVTISMRVTAYCPCEKCCGEWADGVTSNGHVIEPGDCFVAADSRFPFGTEMLIEGYNASKPAKVFDRGGAIKGNKLDVFFHTHQAALEWGVRYIDVKVRKS
ncbi:MAG: 3D domain-containing protein [Phycisphaerae bacterium]|nr:3D domain-containing protein [Phycisphaerae bacterium]